MGKKKRNHPDVEEILNRPWCYYCERDFDDLKILINHQKAKHFKCDKCGRRLNTAGGLNVHMTQVHKETLTQVENALPNRQGLDYEIFGMEGVPEDVMQSHQQRVLQQFYEQQAERRAATGNPPPGATPTAGGQPPKKPKVETKEDLKARLAAHKAKKAQEAAGGSSGDVTPMGQGGQSPAITQSPTAFVNQYQLQQMHQGHVPPSVAGPLGHNGSTQANGHAAQVSQSSFPGLEQSVDDLIASAGKPSEAAKTAETERAKKEEEAPKAKKDVKLVYSDSEMSPEEKMAKLARYAFNPADRQQDEKVVGSLDPPVTGVVSGQDDVHDPSG
ncbi:putative c2h2 finger domain-containing protein [Diplodia seriata]|uniref:Putative c2h2 finger domain-containing protein n=1 Tax=Diplodia seriata TaxID=420778 RepID=A0A0G2DXK0_9PEZI|nr:putative c2h2 finger domain-containing protein [Diplodia seriata]